MSAVQGPTFCRTPADLLAGSAIAKGTCAFPLACVPLAIQRRGWLLARAAIATGAQRVASL
jgi:hypothetical protein